MQICRMLILGDYNIARWRKGVYTIRHWLSRGIDYTKVPRDALRTPTFHPWSPLADPSLPSTLSTNSRRSFPRIYPWSKGLYRAPSNLPELLVVVLCKRPHFVTIAPAGGRPPLPCYASRRSAEKPKSTLHGAKRPPVCSRTTCAAPVEHVFSSGQDRSVCQRRTFP